MKLAERMMWRDELPGNQAGRESFISKLLLTTQICMNNIAGDTVLNAKRFSSNFLQEYNKFLSD